MTKRVQIVRHNTAAADLFNGLEGEITVDTTVKTIRVHDGVNPGGTALAKADMTNAALATASLAGAMSAAKFNEVETNTADTTELFKHTRGFLSKSVAGAVDVTLTGAEAENKIYEFTGVLTGSIEVVFPVETWTIFVINNTTGAFTLKIRLSSEADNSGIEVPQTGGALLVSDGVNVADTLATHLTVINPHNVTAAQAGALGITDNLSDLDNAGTARTNLGLGTVAVEDVGTGTGNIPQLDANGYPAIPGSNIADLDIPRHFYGFTVTPDATDSAHDFTVLPGQCKAEGSLVDLNFPASHKKFLDVPWATGNNAGGFADAAAILNNTTVSFDNAASKILGTGLFGSFLVGATVFAVGSASNDGTTFQVTAATANDITVSPTPVTESAGASITIYQIKPTFPYHIFVGDDGAGGVEIGVDSSITATNFLAKTGGTLYRQLATFVTGAAANFKFKGGFWYLWETYGGRTDAWVAESEGLTFETWCAFFDAWIWGAGGGGALWHVGAGEGGAGGGFKRLSRVPRHYVLGTETITAGTKGNGATANQTGGVDGTDSSIGTKFVVGGGDGGQAQSAGPPWSSPAIGGQVATTLFAPEDENGGNAAVNHSTAAENKFVASCGGGGAYIGASVGGNSTHGGDGGNGSDGGTTEDGEFPGGGGGGSGVTPNKGGDGAHGLVVIRQMAA